MTPPDETARTHQPLGLLELLEMRGFPSSARVKLVRHEDRIYDVRDLLRRGWIETYQSFQSRPVFRDCDYIVSFVGDGGTRARLVGVYHVGECRSGATAPLPPDCPHTEWRAIKHFYELTRVPGYEALEGRVVIDWGKATLAWHQNLRDKPVLEILAGVEVVPIFDDYLQFTVTHRELRTIVGQPEAHRDWRARLSAVAGIYLILATGDGSLYVGSAQGNEGIWGRWTAYAANGHGGNVLLQRLIESDPQYPGSFRYSLLQVLPKSMTVAAVLDWERRYKEKLGSKAHGLNLN